LSIILALSTFGFTRSSLVNQRELTEINQAYINARRVQNELIDDRTNVVGALEQAGTALRMVYIDGQWISSSSNFIESVIPTVLKTRVITDRRPSVMTIERNGRAAIVIGIPLERANVTYFELDPMREVHDALSSVRLALILAGGFTTIVGIGLGLFASRRAVRPLANAAQAARAIADGRLDTRLEPTDDPDLQALTMAFNEMVATLQSRAERDARFTSDVSHELRSPLMTLAASAQVMQARRDELSDRSQAALDLLVSDVARFQSLVEDLLEISRFDAGVVRLVREPLRVAEFVRQAVAVSSLPRTPITADVGVEEAVIHGDRRRLARVIANLIDNARVHSGGTPRIRVTTEDGSTTSSYVWIVVEDDGEGLIAGETEKIFERFSRGGAAGRRSGQEGAGLGLALALEHVTLHGGRIWAENRNDGIRGARFVVELPVEVHTQEAPQSP
jgi:two-component system sensor histidine kinase MtrB